MNKGRWKFFVYLNFGIATIFFFVSPTPLSAIPNFIVGVYFYYRYLRPKEKNHE